MKKLFILFVSCLLLFGFNKTIAQEYVLNENFDNNKNGWDISNTDEAKSKISNGKYQADIKSGIYWLDRILPVEIDEDRDWVFESAMIKKSGDVAYGLTWGGDNLGSRFNFIVSNNKTYSIHRWKDYNVSFYATAVFSSAINSDGNTNKLAVKKTGGKLVFYVNDQYLTEIEYEPLYGKYFGFYGESGSLKIEVDYLRLYYSGEKNITPKTIKPSGDVVFYDDFKDNSNNWPIEGGTGITRSIKNSKYIWEGTGSEFNSNWEFVPIELDQNRDFVIESSIKKVAGPESGWGYGLLWGDDQNRFTIFGSTGNYSIIGDIYTRNPSNFINQGNATNKLTIKKTGDILKFYVNDNYLSQADFKTFSPNKIGVYFYMNDVRIEIDYIKIYYTGEKTIVNQKNIPTGGDVVFKEDFSDNRNSWPTTGGTRVTRSIKNSKYIWEGDSSDFNSNWEFVPITLDQSRDFMIESTIRKVSGPEDGWGYGLLWGSDQNRFTIFGSSGSYSIIGDIYARNPSPSINTGNATNKLTVKKIGDKLKFYVNDNYLAQADFTTFTPNQIGVYFYMNNVRIEIENITITYLTSSSENNEVKKPVVEEVQDRSLLGVESAFVYDFLAIWRDDASNKEKLMNCISPKYLNNNDIDKSTHEVNLYYPTGYKIEKFDKDNSIVTALIWGSDKSWMHRIYFKVVRESGKLYFYPSKVSESNYIYPWDHVDEYVKE